MADGPIVDRRDGDDVLEEARGIAPAYTEEWDPDADDVGTALLTLFSAMAGDVIERLNRVPEKHRVAFFDALGFSREPPQPARLPVTFAVTDDVDENVVISEGTQTVAPAREERPEQVFELPAGGGFEGTPAAIEAVYTVDPTADDIFDHRDPLREGTETELFAGEDLQKHALNIGHADVLNLKSGSRIWVKLGTNAKPDVFEDRLKWEFYGEVETKDGTEENWHRIPRENVSAYPSEDGTVTVRLVLPGNHSAETTEKEIAGIENRWIRCRIPTDTELSEEESDENGTARSPQDLFGVDIRSVELSLVAPDGDASTEILPDNLLSGDVPLDIGPGEEVVDLYPFGESWPLRNTFYVASEEVFTKKGATVKLEFKAATRRTDPSADEASITFEDQVSNGITVTAPLATVPDDGDGNGGFVVLTHPEMETIEGVSDYLEPGIHENVEIRLGSTLRSDKTVVARLQRATPDEEVEEPIPESMTTSVTITPLDGRTPRLSWEYWNGEGWARLPDLDDDTNQLRRSETVSFTVPGDLKATTAAGHGGHWIRARLVSGEYVRVTYDEDQAQDGKVSMSTAGAPPYFGGVRISFDAEDGPVFRPGAVLTRNNLAYSENLAEALTMESSTNERPFFGLPDEKQTLYVGFDGELRDGPINLLFSLADEEYPDGFYPRVRWEYCADPRREEWARLDAEDGTESLTERGIVSLVFREATVPSGRFGERLHWIRARLEGNEFEPGPTPDEPSDSDPAALPVAVTVIDPATDRVVLVNTGDREIDLGGYRIEFSRARPDDRVRTFPAETTLQPRGSLAVATGTKSEDIADVKFEYEHPALDACAMNAVAILTPDGALVTRKVEGVPAPCERWLETVPPVGDPDRTPPIARGIYPNTGWAYNIETIEGEILGSSDGTPNQAFRVSTPPVTEESVWVDELSVLSEGERRELREAQPDAVEEVTGPDEEPVAFWVRWTRVEDFLNSSGRDRHYRLDPTTGRLTFGNGTRGRIPPRGVDNVRIDYRTGGGAAGNVEVGAVTDLISSIPFVDAVTNPEPGDGGADAESVDRVVARAPKELRDRGKAVSREDFERIAKAASRTLARVRCIPAMDKEGEYSPGWVTVLIVPNDRRAKPVPSVELKRRVSEAVSERAPARLVAHAGVRSGADAAPAPELVVRGPSYLEVAIETTVEAGDVGSISALEARVTSGVDAFLHPLTGGEVGAGWGFGELPCLSDLYALLEGVDGVDHVVDLSMTFHGAEEEVIITEGEESPNVAADTLIFSGTHTIEVDGSDEVAPAGRR